MKNIKIVHSNTINKIHHEVNETRIKNDISEDLSDIYSISAKHRKKKLDQNLQDVIEIISSKCEDTNNSTRCFSVDIDTQIKITFNKEIQAFLIKDNQKLEIKKENVPKDLLKINTPELFDAFLTDAYVKLLSNDSNIKININQRLKGGGLGTDDNNRGVEEYTKGNYEKALEYFTKAVLANSSEVIFKNNKSDALNKVGDKHYNDKEYLKAIEYYDQAYQATNKQDSEALYLGNKAHALQNLQRYTEAIEYFDRAYSKKANDSYKNSKASSLNQLGNKLFNEKKYEEAIERYEEAISIKPNETSYYSNKANALASSVQKQEKKLSVHDYAFLNQALLSNNLLNKKNGCLALLYAAEKNQILPNNIIINLLEITNKQELGEICEYSSKALRFSLLKDKDFRSDKSIIALLEEGLKHPNVNVKDNIIFSLGYIARNGDEIPSLVIYAIEENLQHNQHIEQSLDALHNFLIANREIEISLKTTKVFLNIAIGNNYSFKLREQSIECLSELSSGNKSFSSILKIVNDLPPMLESQYPKFRNICLEIIESCIRKSDYDFKLSNNLIDSLVCVLDINTSKTLNILEKISKRQKLPDRMLLSLSNTLIYTNEDSLRNKTLLVLEEQKNKFGLKDDVGYLVQIEEKASILDSDANLKTKLEAIKLLQKKAESGKFLTRNCLEKLNKTLINGQNETKIACSRLICSIVLNDQEIPQYLSDSISSEIIRNNELHESESKVLSKINILKSKLSIPVNDLVLVLLKVIQNTDYIPKYSIKAFETCITKNQPNINYNNAFLGLKILIQRGHKLNDSGIENCIDLLIMSEKNNHLDFGISLSDILKDVSKNQSITKRHFDQIFKLLPSDQKDVQNNLIDTVVQILQKTDINDLENYLDSKKVSILEKLIKDNKIGRNLSRIVEFIPEKNQFFADYIDLNSCLEILHTDKKEEKNLSATKLFDLMQKGHQVFKEVIGEEVKVLQQNLDIKEIQKCLFVLVQENPRLIGLLNLDVLSENCLKSSNFEDIGFIGKVIRKCAQAKVAFSDSAISNLSNLLFSSNVKSKALGFEILVILNKNKPLPNKILNLLALEEDYTDDVHVLKLACERLSKIDEFSENHLKKLEAIISSQDIELFYEGSRIALRSIRKGFLLSEQIINKIIHRTNNKSFTSDCMILVPNLHTSDSSKKIFFSKITDCLEGDDLIIKYKCLKNLGYLSEFVELPKVVEEKILNFVQVANGEYDVDLISKISIGLLGDYYSRGITDTSDTNIFKSRFNHILEKIIQNHLPQRLIDNLRYHLEQDRLYISSKIISSNLIDFEVFDSVSTKDFSREILLSKLLEDQEHDEIYLQKFFGNLDAFERNNSYGAYNLNRDKILKLLAFQKENYDLSVEKISDIFKFLSVDCSSIDDSEFLSPKFFSISKSNWINTIISRQVGRKSLLKQEVGLLLNAFESNNFHTVLIEKFISRLQFSSEDDIGNQIISFLEFTKANKISQSSLISIISSRISPNKNSLLEWQKSLSKQLLINRFNENGRQGSRILDIGWDLHAIINLINQINIKKPDADTVKQVFDIISGYKIPQNFSDKNNISVGSIITNYRHIEWIKKLHKLAINFNFSSSSVEKSPEVLIEEIKKLNPDIDVEKLKQQLKEIDAHYDAIENWKKENIESWLRSECKTRANEKEFLPKMLAVLSVTNKITSGNKPRATQLLSLLMMMNSRSDKGRIAQIATGEGKSTITAMLGAVKALQGEKVDIITSSEVLAARDAEEKRSFFNLLNLTVSDNGRNNAPDCYKSNIVYGDITDFEGDLLRHEFNRSNTKGDRGFGAVIVDEVDSMCIDNLGSSTRLGSHFAGLEYLDILLTTIWQQLDMLDKQITKYKGKLIYLPPELKIENENIIPVSEDIEISEDDIIEIDSRRDFTKNLLKSNIKKIINESSDAPSENQLRIPGHLVEFANIELEEWIDSAVTAKYYYTENKSYIIAKSRRDNEKTIAPVDYQNTGVVQVSTTWNNGLHQFLQLKHGLKITPENLTTSFISNIGYFNRYINKNQQGEVLSNKIYGLTGTLGSKDSQELLKDTYGVDIVFIPTYKQKQFIELPAITALDWENNVVKSIQEETSKDRATLVICQTIDNTETIRKELLNKGYSGSKIRVYGRSDNDDIKVIQDAIDVGDVIIATNLAGRGTDIKTTEALEKNGGLHVCVTFLPTNLRVEEQAFGRTSRQGKSGTAQLILDTIGNIENIKEERDGNESKRLEQIKSSDIERIKIKDELFKNFCELMNKLKNLEDDEYKLSCLEEQWGLWLRGLDLDNKDEKLNINEVWNNFRSFESRLSSGYINGNVVHNPFSHIQKANDLLNKKKYREAIEYYDKAINIDAVFSFAAHYNKSYAIIQLKEHNYKNRALAELKEVAERVEKYISPQVQTIQIVFAQVYQANNKNPNDTDLHKQVVERCDIINNFTGYINHAITVLEDSLKPENEKHEIKISNKKDLKYFVEQDIASKATINQIKQAGLIQFYELNSKPPRPWLSIAAVAGLGLAQATAGALITVFSAGTATQIGVALISEGVSDLICATQAAITGNFSWTQYATQKAISMTVSIVCMGWSALKTGLKAAKEGFITGAKALKNVTINGFKSIAGKITGRGLIKEGLSTAVKQVGVKITEKGIERLAVCGVNKIIEIAFEAIKENTSKYFREHLSEKLNSTNTVLMIDSLLAIDSYLRNTHWQNHIKKSAMEIIHPQRNKWLSHFESGLKQILPKVAGDYSKDLSTIIKISEFGSFISDLSKLFFEFYDSFHNSLEGSHTPKEFNASKNGLNSLEHLIRNIDHNLISDSDAQNIVILLHEQGVMDNEGGIDSKILYGNFEPGVSFSDSQRKILVSSTIKKGVKEKIKSIDDIHLGDYAKYKPQVIKLCKDLRSQLTTDHNFLRNKLYQEISEEILGNILNMFNDYMIRPATSRFIERQIGNISEMMQIHFNSMTFAEEANQYRSKYQLSLAVNNVAISNIDEKIEHLPEEKKQLVREAIANKKGDITDLGAISSKLGRPIAVYKNGELYDIIGDKNQGEPIKIDYDPKNGGHFNPNKIKNFINQEQNNCLFEAIAYQAKKQGIIVGASELKIYAALDKVENSHKYSDVKMYYNHLTSYGDHELMMVGGEWDRKNLNTHFKKHKYDEITREDNFPDCANAEEYGKKIDDLLNDESKTKEYYDDKGRKKRCAYDEKTEIFADSYVNEKGKIKIATGFKPKDGKDYIDTIIEKNKDNKPKNQVDKELSAIINRVPDQEIRLPSFDLGSPRKGPFIVGGGVNLGEAAKESGKLTGFDLGSPRKGPFIVGGGVDLGEAFKESGELKGFDLGPILSGPFMLK